MQEYWDLLLPDGTPTGEIMPATMRIPDDRCTLVVHIFIADQQGRFLLQKRSMKKKYFPGIWDSTGGRVLAGESGEDAILREAFEEVGLTIQRSQLHYIDRYRLPWRNFFDVYCAKVDFRLEDCCKQDEEVDELRLVSYEEAVAMIRASKPESSENYYFEAFEKAAHILGVLG